MLTKNLCFYLYPIKGSTWPFHVKQLKHYWGIFNGKKIVTVSTDERTVEVEEVQKALDTKDVVWRVVKNDSKLGETAHLSGALETVRNTSADEFTFYAHGKGAGYMDLAKRIWCEAMYYFSLGSREFTEEILSKYDAMGSFRHSHSNHGGGKWHYSGTFFWFRHSSVFASNWTDIEPNNYGVEGWPGRHIPLDRSFSTIEPPDFPSFMEQWKQIENLPSISRWDPSTAIARFSAVDRGMEAWMKMLMAKARIHTDVPKRPAYSPTEFITT